MTLAGRLTDAHGSSYGFLVPMAGTALALATLVALRAKLAPKAPSRTASPAAGAADAGADTRADTERGVGHRVPVTVD